MARSKKNKTSIGCLFWIALILLVLVIFLFNRETIQNVLEETGFMEIIQKETEETPPEVKQVEIPEVTAEEPSPEIIIEEPPEETIAPETVIALEVKPATPEPETAVEKSPEPDKRVRRSKMYFIEIQDDGNIVMKDIVRPVYYVNSPLTETMKTLLDGLSGSELNMGLISLIPDQTKLISINLKDNIAYINFTDSFRFNAFGVEGYNAQLKQVVFTATEFSNVESVQILIEGSVIDYMGPEGVYIGKPLSRNDF